MSLSKQATQMPIFAGLPHFCKSWAKTPIKAPTEIIPQRVAKNRVSFDMPTPPVEFHSGKLSPLLFTSENSISQIGICDRLAERNREKR
jgi:hypothetical protein